MNGLRDLSALAADDAETERTIDALHPDELFELATYAAAWDEQAEAAEEAVTRRGLVRPVIPWRILLPLNIVLIVITAIALSWR